MTTLLQNDLSAKADVAGGDEKAASTDNAVVAAPSSLHDQIKHPANGLKAKQDAVSPEQADETALHSHFPSVPTTYLPLTVFIYRLLSFFLSLAFLGCTVLFALFKTLPSLLWILVSYAQFKDPDRNRPFYALEQDRRRSPRRELRMDVGYYAQLVGLKSEEVKVETEDGFMLTVQHIIDVRPGAPDWKRLCPPISRF
jgi:hypothetical protein